MTQVIEQNFQIIIQLCQEDRERLDKILQALQQPHNCDKCVDGVLRYVKDAEPDAAPEQDARTCDARTCDATPAEPAADPEPATPAEPATPEAPAAAPVHTKADIQRKVVELSAAGKKDKVREIVTAYAAKVSAIPDDKIDEVWDKLSALEG